MSFSEESLIKKFQDLSNTQQSVQTLSLWLIHHRKQAKLIVTIWLKELLNEKKPERKLTFIYLANDLLQNSRKKGAEYQTEFTRNVLLEAIQSTALVGDSKLRFTLERILNIWKDRKIFNDNRIEAFKNALHNPDKVVIENLDDNILRSPTASATAAAATIDVIPKRTPSKKPAIVNSDDEESMSSKRSKRMTESSGSNNSVTTPTKHVTFVSTETSEKEVLDLKVPDALELIAMLYDLEQSASSDAVVRGRIAELPSQISDTNSVHRIKDSADMADFSRKVSDSLMLIDDYNQRLNEELIQRKRTAFLLSAFIKQQQKELDNDRQVLSEWRIRMKQVDSVRNEIKTHLKSLPDLKIIDEAAELSPLPTATDLFST